VITEKRPVDELFMHYFYKQSLASGTLPPDPTWTPLGDFCLHTSNLPNPEKILRSPMVAWLIS